MATCSSTHWPFPEAGESDQKKVTKDGLLLVVAINDRKYYTQVSRHLEGDLNDGLVGQIQRDRLVPQFKQGNYRQGIYDTVQAYVATLAEKRGFKVEGVESEIRRSGTARTTLYPTN